MPERDPIVTVASADAVTHARRLHGRRLYLAWFVSAGLVMLALGLFLVALPVRYSQLLDTARQATHAYEQLAPGERSSLLIAALSPGIYPPAVLGIEVAVVLSLALCSALIAWQRRHDWMALFVVVALVVYGVWVTPPLDALMRLAPAWRPVANALQATGWAFAVIFFYLLPDGRMTPRWTRPLAGVVAAWALGWALWPDAPWSFAFGWTLPPLWYVTQQGWWATGVLAQLTRYRRDSTPTQRQQTRLILVNLTLAFLGSCAIYLPHVLLGPPTEAGLLRLLYDQWAVPLFLVGLIPIPLTITFSVLRYQLFDARVAVRRTLIYGPLTAVLALVYVAAVTLMEAAFRALTGQGSDLAIVASTLAIAALFQPLRWRIQAFIDRRFYRRQYDAAHTLAAFSAHVRDDVDLTTLRNELVSVVRETMQPASVAVWIRPSASVAPATDQE